MIASFRNAFAGLAHALRSQRNLRIHLAVTVLVGVVGAGLGLRALEWSVLALAVGLVWVAELFNTALETIVDLASPEQRPLARVAKDVSAGAVLAAALTAAATGLLVMGPPLLDRLR